MRVREFKSPPEKNNVTQFHILAPQRGEMPWKSPLKTVNALASTWEPPLLNVIRGPNAPDFFHCLTDWAVTPEVVEAISTRVGEDVEFLPIECDYEKPLFLLHVLKLVELGPNANATRNSLCKNITSIYKPDFDIGALSSCSLIRVKQAPGSAARNAGLACGDVYAVGEFADFLIECSFQGVDLVTVFDREE